ncbi:MAG: flagellar hook-associated protein FlgK [Lachnospiraceae bacterium]|nr:flagellar hook-associated protein FlgK [Lachnospiraceae bacterium]
MNMPLMQDLLVGVSGLNVAQRSITMTAHNLANVETEGFVRQQIIQDSSHYNTIGFGALNYLQVGIGVDTGAVYQARDSFLDRQYRTEIGREAFYSTQYAAVQEIEELFGELNGVAFQDNIEQLWYSIQELAKDPTSLTTRATLVETAVTFSDRAESIYNMLKKYQTDLDTQVEEMVVRINQIGADIVKLNDEICACEAADQERANDLRDRRNALLDELGGMVRIDYRENADSRIYVNIEEVPFVTEDTHFEMSTVRSADLRNMQLKAQGIEPSTAETNTALTGLVPVWPAYGFAEVINMSRAPSSEQNTDIGELRGLLLTKGIKTGNYTDIPYEPKISDFTAEDGTFDRMGYDLAMTQFQTDLFVYNTYVDTSVIVNVQSQFDTLIHGIVTTINDILCPNKEVTLQDGSKVWILDEENAPEGMDVNHTKGEALFNRKSEPRYTRKDITLEDGTTVSALVYNEEDPANNYTLYTLGELEVNPHIKENLSRLPLSRNGGTGDYDASVCNRLIQAWQDPQLVLTPTSLAEDTFYEYYNELIGALATRGEELRTISENQQTMTNKIDEQRTSVTGVSSDEELTNLIRFQHAYNASSRYINVINEMLETIIERL